jgi:hypothetical protein
MKVVAEMTKYARIRDCIGTRSLPRRFCMTSQYLHNFVHNQRAAILHILFCISSLKYIVYSCDYVDINDLNIKTSVNHESLYIFAVCLCESISIRKSNNIFMYVQIDNVHNNFLRSI